MSANGTRRKRGNITKRGKGWQIKFSAPSPDGTRKQRYATVRGSYQDAQKELTRLLGEADQGTLPEPTRQTIAQYLRTWLDNSEGKRSPKTLERYRELAENQIIRHLGEHLLQKLRPEHIEAWHADLLATGLKPGTVFSAHNLLRFVLSRAVKTNAIARNPTDNVDPPKVEAAEIEILSATEISAVLDALRDHTLYPIVSLALATGMRRGELLGLQWGDVDLDGGCLNVERSLEETKAGLRIKPPKTRRGRRKITLPAEAVAMLRTHKLEQMQFRLTVGLGKLAEDSPVFSDLEGNHRKPNVITSGWRYVVRSKKLPKVGFHALRHTHASVLIRDGIDILTISRRLGHSKASITLDTYGHLMSGSDAAAALAIGKVLK